MNLYFVNFSELNIEMGYHVFFQMLLSCSLSTIFQSIYLALYPNNLLFIEQKFRKLLMEENHFNVSLMHHPPPSKKRKNFTDFIKINIVEFPYSVLLSIPGMTLVSINVMHL
jgi:hypothetical protein